MAIVEHLDELEDRLARIGSRHQRFAVDELEFQHSEPALRDDVIPALLRARQTLSDLVAGEQPPEVNRGVLEPTVAVENQSRAGPRAATAIRSASQTSSARM